MELPLTLRSSRKKYLLLLVASLGFVAAGFWLVPEQPVTGYLSIVLFGLGAVMFCVNLLPKSSYLRLTSEGFTMCNLFRCHSIEWRHVSSFGVARIGTKKMVGWDPAHPISKIGKTTKFVSGYVSTLPDTYGLTAENLAELMNRLRDEYAPAQIT